MSKTTSPHTAWPQLRPNLMVKTVYIISFGVFCFILLGSISTATNSISLFTSSRKEVESRPRREVNYERSSLPTTKIRRKEAGEASLFESRNETFVMDNNKTNDGVINSLSDKNDVIGSVLMVVAHPDDEVLWGGEYLLEEGHKVHVVVTCTKNPQAMTRFDEFRAVQTHLGYHGEFLDGKDSAKTTELERHIQQHIQKLVCGKKWDRIITHGPEGEYGHPQHQIVHDAVLDAVQMCCGSSDKLFVFEPHASKNHVFSDAKQAVAKLYKSQERVIFRTFGKWKEQIVPFEKYDYKTASSTCRNHQNPKKTVHPFRQCRLHKMLNFSDVNYRSDLLLGPFSDQGSGC